MDYRKLFLVESGDAAGMTGRDAGATPGSSKDEAEARLAPASERLSHLQSLLYAQKRRALLIVLQGMDASGKDGAIRHAFSGFNPQGVIVTSFKEPSTRERAHDFLWRVHPHAPEFGAVAIFNRSQYEDFLVSRAHGLMDAGTRAARLEQIRNFESLLAENGVTILKFALNISKEQQLDRFRKRLFDPGRNWKIAESDYSERLLWDDYMRAYDEMLGATSLPHAPWYTIPADRKWFRDLAIAEIAIAALEDLDMRYPAPSVDLADIERKYHSAVADQNGAGKKDARVGAAKSAKGD